jgi:hypothetical protein
VKPETPRCHHHPVTDKKHAVAVDEQIKKVEETHVGNPKLFDFSFKTMLHYYPDQPNKEKDPLNVEHHASNHTARGQWLAAYVVPDLMRLGLSLDGTPREHVERLTDALKLRWEMVYMLREKEGCVYEKAQTTVDINPPCILHCENRVGERILLDCLTEGINNNLGPKKQAEWEKVVTNVINTRLLGSMYRKANWYLKKNANNGLGHQSMPNYYAREFMDNIELVADICFVDDKRKAEFLEMCHNYNMFIRCARKREDLTDEEIEQCQDYADKFYAQRIELFGYDGITNYIHMIGAGHFKHFLVKYRNLYRFSQQGWEAYNHLIKSFYYRRTQRGGAKGRSGEFKVSKMEPIAKWIVRKLFWQQGLETELDYMRNATYYKTKQD